MRDDKLNWPLPYAEGRILKSDTVRIIHATPPTQTLLSGTGLARHPALADVPRIGWPDPAPADELYALVLRRDRLLVVNGAPLTPGWDAEQACAVSDISAGFAVFDCDGTGALELIRRFTPLFANTPSASVMRRCNGVEWAIYHIGDTSRLRLHIPRAEAPAVWRALHDEMRSMA